MFKLLGQRLLGFLRIRVILCGVGLYICYTQPHISHWAVTLISMALGVSALDAFKKKPTEESKEPSEEDKP